jgi:hypothetical protein
MEIGVPGRRESDLIFVPHTNKTSVEHLDLTLYDYLVLKPRCRSYSRFRMIVANDLLRDFLPSVFGTVFKVWC